MMKKKLLKFARGNMVVRDGSGKVTGYCVLGALGKSVRMSNSELDITTEWVVLQEAEKKFRFLSDLTEDEIVIANDRGNWKRVNDWLLRHNDLYNKVKKFALNYRGDRKQ